MKNVFLVGGAVRDMLMGIEPKDRDYVVVGSTPEDMLAAGFEQVGADFPVFLHPETGDEYALARREKKTGSGYLGFTSEFGVDVTLEDDLQRRDCTINSMAFEEELGNPGYFLVHDYFDGKDDLHNKILRHTSDAFQEDPVRVLRVARFRARLGKDWTVAPETKDLIRMMGKRGVLNELTAERVWKEMSRALVEKHPRLFFDTLHECDVLHVLFPEVYRLMSALESMKWHPEGNAYEHTMLVLTQAALQFPGSLDHAMMALVHDFGKGVTPLDQLPAHHGHDVKGVPVVKDFCAKWTVPARLSKRLALVTRFHMNMHRLDSLNPKTFVKMFTEMDAFRDPEVVQWLHDMGCMDHRGRLGSENEDVSNNARLLEVFEAVKSVTFADAVGDTSAKPEAIKQKMFAARVQAAKTAA